VTDNLPPPPSGAQPAEPSWGTHLWRRISTVPLAVMVVVFLAVLLAAVAIAAEVIQPGSSDVATSTVDQPRAVPASRPLPGAVDNSGVPGPAPAGAGDVASVATVGGTVTLQGRVEDDGRPLGGARVELTRWVGEQSASLVLEANAEGDFAGEGLVGGLWTVTAWKEPQHRRADSQRVFMSDGQTATLTIRPPLVDAVALEAVAGPPTDDGLVAVVVTAETQVVNATGEVVGVGATGTATIVYPPRHRGPADVGVAVGVGEFVVECLPPAGSGRITVRFGTRDVQVEVPGCQPQAPTTTTPEPTTTLVPTTTTPAPTTTTQPGRR
jgi:hypothetical protein